MTDSGGFDMVETTITTTSNLEKRRQADTEKLFKTAKSLAAHFPELRALEIKETLEVIRQEYAYKWRSVASIEAASKAKEDLLKLAEKADELMSTILSLGQGAVEAMALPVNDAVLEHEGDPSGLPCREPGWQWPREFKSSKEAYELYGSNEDEDRGGRWAVRLHALSELANLQAQSIWERAGKGGPHASPIYRNRPSAKMWLAQACTNFACENGCNSQVVILEMNHAILELEHGEEALYHRTNKKPSPDIGRKAVREAIRLYYELADS